MMYIDDGVKSFIKIFVNIFIFFIGVGILGMFYVFKEVWNFFFVIYVGVILFVMNILFEERRLYLVDIF